MNVNLATVITGSIAFILFQVVLWWLFHSPLTRWQWAGILIIMVGMAMATWGGTPEPADK